MKLTRREFLGTTAAAAAGSVLLPGKMFGQDATSVPTVQSSATIWVVKGTDIPAMVKKGIEALGGWQKFVVSGKKTTVKPNSGWFSKPEEGGNTDPLLVGEVVAACLAAGASEVVVPEKTCSGPKSFIASGIGEAVKKAGGRMYELTEKKFFRQMTLPQAKVLKKADVAIDVLDTACLINMPVAKVHGGATLTMSMKNWMGSVEDRGFWHRTGLHQCIADCCTLIKPSLVILDATRIMLTNGPRGPGELAHPNELVFGTDQVAVDAYCTTLFGKKPFDVEHIRIAHDMGIGCGKLENIKIERIA